MKMELNSLGAAREDTHGTPEKLRGKMYSFFFFFVFLFFSPSLLFPELATRQPRLLGFLANSVPSSPPSHGNHPLPRRPFQLLELVRRYSSGYATTTRTATFLIPLLSASPAPPPPTNPSFRCKWPFYVDSCSFSRANMPWQMYIYMCVCVYVHACMILRSFSRLR